MEIGKRLVWFEVLVQDHHAEVQPYPKKEVSLSVAPSRYSVVDSLDLAQVRSRSFLINLFKVGV